MQEEAAVKLCFDNHCKYKYTVPLAAAAVADPKWLSPSLPGLTEASPSPSCCFDLTCLILTSISSSKTCKGQAKGQTCRLHSDQVPNYVFVISVQCYYYCTILYYTELASYTELHRTTQAWNKKNTRTTRLV